MGVCDSNIKNRKHKALMKELSSINNDKYSCVYCYRIPEIKEIEYDNQNIVIFCPEHGRKKIKIEDYLNQMTNIVQGKCKECGEQNCIVYDFQKNNYFCEKCINKDYKKNKSSNDKKCKEHPKEDFSAFCQTCNHYICSEFEKHKNYHENHQIFKKNEYEPDENDLNLILLFNKLITLIYESFLKDENNFYHCINIKNFVNFIKGSNLLNLFNKSFNCNIKSNDKKINLKNKKIGDFGFQLLCKLNLEELEQLILSNNNISNIDDLKILNFQKIKEIKFRT